MKKGNEIIAHNVKLLREISGLTQAEFAVKHRVIQKSIWSYESGYAKPGPVFILSLAKSIGISPELLFTLKLKVNARGVLSNIPSADNELYQLRLELQQRVNKFKKDTEEFLKGINSLNERIDLIEKRIKARK